jgi:hypothetical protein
MIPALFTSGSGGNREKGYALITYKYILMAYAVDWNYINEESDIYQF